MVGLPVITKEIGDTWLYGVPSDPFKNVKFRELSRHRRECIERGVCDVADITMQRFDRLLTKIPEHTWGRHNLVSKLVFGLSFLTAGDYMNDQCNRKGFELTRIPHGNRIMVRPTKLFKQRRSAEKDKKYSALARKMKDAMESVCPSIPDTTGYEKVVGTPAEQSENVYSCHGQKYRINMDMSMILDADEGKHKEEDVTSPAAEHVLGLYTYQTLDALDYTKFDKDYGMAYCTPTTEDAGCHNFNKPNMTARILYTQRRTLL